MGAKELDEWTRAAERAEMQIRLQARIAWLLEARARTARRLEVAKTSTGSKVKHTSPTKLRAIKVGIPPTLKEQEEIATALATTERKIEVETAKQVHSRTDDGEALCAPTSPRLKKEED